VPDGPESIGEVARLIRQLEAHIDRRFQSLEDRQRGFISIELHNAEKQGIDRRLEQLTEALGEERTARKEGIKSIGVISRWAITVSVAALGVLLTILVRGSGVN
jgi:hypothetical protein